MMREAVRDAVLVVDAGGRPAGIPLACVRETMRPLPIVSVSGAPDFVLGVAVIRGATVPVVDLGSLLGLGSGERSPGRFVTLEVDGRCVALAVTGVRGIAELPDTAAQGLPPLLNGAANEVIQALALHDEALLILLRAARLVPEPWPAEPS